MKWILIFGFCITLLFLTGCQEDSEACYELGGKYKDSLCTIGTIGTNYTYIFSCPGMDYEIYTNNDMDINLGGINMIFCDYAKVKLNSIQYE